MKTSKKSLKEKYSFKNYKANKNCKPVTYQGTEYKSKTQCCVLNDITIKELNEYLKNDNN